MADYPRATFYGACSNNYGQANRPSSNPINKIVIHVTQGSWSSAINYFKDCSAYVSAHYTVRSSDGFIGQSVREKDIAYHAGNYSYNETSIGIEHEGYISDPSWFTEAMYDSSARLSAHLCDKYNIPIDRNHIIGHSEVPGATHTDPGRYWDWGHYMSLVREYAGGSTGSDRYVQAVDNTTGGRFYAPSSVWGTSSYSSQKAGKNYRFTTPASENNNAVYRLRVPSKGRYAVYAWWPANSGYNDRTRYWIHTTNGWIPKLANQRTNGGKWNYLGTYAMDAGDYWLIAVSNRSSGKGYIIADAVAIVESK